MGQWPRMAAWLMHWYSAVSRAARCLQENFTALYLLCAGSIDCHAAAPSCNHACCGSSNSPAARPPVLPHSLKAFMAEPTCPRRAMLALVRERAREARLLVAASQEGKLLLLCVLVDWGCADPINV